MGYFYVAIGWRIVWRIIIDGGEYWVLHDAAIIGDSLISGRWESERELWFMIFSLAPMPLQFI